MASCFKEKQSDRRRVVIALRERNGCTITFVRKSEAVGTENAKARVAAKSVIFADEASHWDGLEMHCETGRINHSEMYSDLNGKHINAAESFFSPLRRMVQGQHHHVSRKYLH